jgi:hypothetical protein
MLCGEVDCVDEILIHELSKLEKSHYNKTVDCYFSDDKKNIGKNIKKFITIDMKCVYIELNSFDNNTDEWFFICIGVDSFSENFTNFEWICDGSIRCSGDYKLHGMENIQCIYKSDNETIFSNACNFHLEKQRDVASLLILSRFQRLIKESLLTTSIRIPVLVTSHGYDCLACFYPVQKRSTVKRQLKFPGDDN